MDNDRRADRADAVVSEYVGPERREIDVDPRAWLVDLLTDLRHWADRDGLDFDKANEVSKMHHECEVEENRGTDRKSIQERSDLRSTLAIPLASIGMTPKVRRTCHRLGAVTLGDLAMVSDRRLRKMRPPVGVTTILAIGDVLRFYGLTQGMCLRPLFGIEVPDLPEPASDRVLDTSVDSLEFGARVSRLLDEARVRTLRDLVRNSEWGLLARDGWGPRAVGEVVNKLKHYGLALARKPEEEETDVHA